MNPQEEITKLWEEINKLRNNTTIPLEVGEAFKARILPDGTVTGRVVGDAPDTVTVTVGLTDYVVAGPMDGFISITINGNTYRLPYYV